MRRLFIVLAKLVGLLQLYWALVNFMQIGFTLSMVGRSESTQFGQILVSVIGLGAYFLLSLGMAWLLLARTEWLAGRLRILDDAEIEGLDKHPVLLVGVKLIGVYVTVYAIPSLARALLDAQRLWQGQIGLQVWNRIIPAALQVALGLFLALRSEKVVEVMTKKQERAEPSAAPLPSAPAGPSEGAR
jgi:hypothetical protein